MLIRDACWQQSADVVVVGYGGAGAVAAITAHDLGAEVLLVEKQPRDHHYTNTRMSGGAFMCSGELEKLTRHAAALYHVQGDLAWTDPDTLRAWAEYVCDNRQWVQGLGGKVKLFSRGGEQPEVPEWEHFENWMFAGSGVGMHRFLTSLVARRGISVLYDTPAQKLLTDLNGNVVGVRVAMGEDRHAVDIKAHRAVILTTGGFEFNEGMKLNYLGVYPVYFYGSPANTGDGIRMAMEAGCQLWHMNCCSGRMVAKFPDFPIAFSLDLGGRDATRREVMGKALTREEACGFVIVDRDGRRFTSENFKGHTVYYEMTVYDSHRLWYPRDPSFWIFDQKRIESGPLPHLLAGPAGPVRLYRWSADNRAEIEKGWIIQGDTVGELAKKLGLPADNLEMTVRQYNGYCDTGSDAQFDRRTATLVPLRNPPYYAVSIYPGGPNTQGGPRRDHRARVLNVDGGPIPGLYAAGELGSVYGLLYPAGGSNLAECIAFGRIAAENAVREKPRP